MVTPTALISPQAAAAGKFEHPDLTAKGEPRARVAFKGLRTLWFNTGTLCNITCQNCYIESSPRNDRLAYLTLADVMGYLDEIRDSDLPVEMIGFTGGEPFMNPDIIAILTETLNRGFETLVLTNAMQPMMRRRKEVLGLKALAGGRLRIRVSLDDHRADVHDAERGSGAFNRAMDGLRFLSDAGIPIEIAGRRFHHEPEPSARQGYQELFHREGIAVDCADPVQLVIFPEMTANTDPPEITQACWGILGMSPDDVMCATSRMVVRRRGAPAASVVACTLIAYDTGFEFGARLADAAKPVALNHRFCATFCVLGGAACGAAKSSS